MEIQDIVSTVRKHVKLVPFGANFLGRCPFHKEKTGSFCVDQQRQIFKCFGCGKTGDATEFLRLIAKKKTRDSATSSPPPASTSGASKE